MHDVVVGRGWTVRSGNRAHRLIPEGRRRGRATRHVIDTTSQVGRQKRLQSLLPHRLRHLIFMGVDDLLLSHSGLASLDQFVSLEVLEREGGSWLKITFGRSVGCSERDSLHSTISLI